MHVFLYLLRETHSVCAPWLLKVGQIWDVEAVRGLLFGELVWVNVPLLQEIVIEGRLPRKLASVNFLGPKGVFS